ncbi:MAG: ATPase [Alphaproteobacteria bacterium]|jgi:glucosamine kinase|nr:ATPase [Alphaproteobacteria bacterium]
MDSRLFCCVDGGASNTRVALYDDAGRRLGLSVGGPTSLTLRGAGAWQEILTVLENVARAVSLEGDYLAQTHFGIGLAGANNSSQRELFMDAAPSAGGLRVSTDAYIAALGAHGGAAGAIVIVGTGSVGYRIEAAGRCRLAGGWGFQVGDEGSGAWIGRQAIKQTVRVVDARHRRPATALHRAVTTCCGSTRDEMLDWLWGAEPAKFAEIAPLVLECAGDGDMSALAIVTEAGREIDALAEALDPARNVPLALVGGLAEPLDPFLPDRLRNWARAPNEEPIVGALMLAQGRAPDETIVWKNR